VALTFGGWAIYAPSAKLRIRAMEIGINDFMDFIAFPFWEYRNAI
jgi:hypothetical protein